MLKLLEDERDIAFYQKKLTKILKNTFNTTEERSVGYPGGQKKGIGVFHNNQLWYWNDLSENTPSPRFLNWLGFWDYKKNLNISVELNIPKSGINNLVASCFAEDVNTGKVYLLHNGRVGGGGNGIGKATFLDYLKPKMVYVYDSKKNIRESIVLMEINSNASIDFLVKYVTAISDFKKLVKTGDLNFYGFNQNNCSYDDYFNEFSGVVKVQKPSNLVYMSWHGLVVDALKEWCDRKILTSDSKIVKNKYIDLGIISDGQLIELYEVKTNTETSTIYTAIGQLLTHAKTENCKKIIVLPSDEEISTGFCNVFTRLDIKVMKYEIIDNKVNLL